MHSRCFGGTQRRFLCHFMEVHNSITFIIRTTGTLDMRLPIDNFKGRDVEIHQEPHHRPLRAR
eukprot:9685491-Heterocapsa_arctica.AAC.1